MEAIKVLKTTHHSEDSQGDQYLDLGYLRRIDLKSSQSAGAIIVDKDGVFSKDLLLYLYKKNHIALPASLTKVMTTIVLLDLGIDLQTKVTKTQEDSSKGNGPKLNEGESLTLEDALHNLMLSSSNVTANMIARIYGGKALTKAGITTFSTTEAHTKWVEMLNTKAQAIGMSSTIFSSSSGLDVDSSAAAKTNVLDMLKMFCYATRYNVLMEVWSKPKYTMSIITTQGTIRSVELTSSVVPLREGDQDILGGKTGTLKRYGYNLGEIAVLPDGRYVAIVCLGATSDADRTSDIRSIVSRIRRRYSRNAKARSLKIHDL